MSVTASKPGAEPEKGLTLTLPRSPIHMLNDTLEAQRFCNLLTMIFSGDADLQLRGEQVEGVQQALHSVLQCIERLQDDASELSDAHRAQFLGK